MTTPREVGVILETGERVEWRISDFLFLVEDGNSLFIDSPQFTASEKNCRLELCVPARERRNDSPLTGYISIDVANPVSSHVAATFGLETTEGDIVEFPRHTKTRIPCERFTVLSSSIPNRWLDYLRSRESWFLPSGTLTITCRLRIGDRSAQREPGVEECQVCRNRIVVKTEEKEGKKSRNLAKLSDDLKDLLLNGVDTDVVLKVGDKEFKAHRLIIRTRSPVLFAMFAHDTEEGRNGVVNIEDCDPNAFADFLRYVYTGRVEAFTPDKALHLYRTADKYQILELKEQCLELLKRNMSVDNFFHIMALSHQHNERELKEIATQFFLDNVLEIVETPRWQTFVAENVATANELILKGFRKCIVGSVSSRNI